METNETKFNRTVEYKVRPVTRYLVTRFEAASSDGVASAGSSVVGEFDNRDMAQHTANALWTHELFHGRDFSPEPTAEVA